MIDEAAALTVLKAALPQLSRLPRLVQRKVAIPEQRLAAYQRFSTATWEATSSLGALRMIAPFASAPVRGLWRQGITHRLLEKNVVTLGELTAAFDNLRLVGTTATVESAMSAVDRIRRLGELITTKGGEYDAVLAEFGDKQRLFLAAARIDLGYDEDPGAPKWYQVHGLVKRLWRRLLHRPIEVSPAMLLADKVPDRVSMGQPE